MSSRPELRIDWCDIKAARYAVMHWHYSHALPAGTLIKVGAWECGKFIGCVLFGRGASPRLASPFGLHPDDVCELVRVALSEHVTPVSRIVSIALKFLAGNSPNLRMVISFADSSRGHHGGIYQAGNWIYVGSSEYHAFLVNGEIFHPKTLHSRYGVGGQSVPWLREHVDPNAERIHSGVKHKYVMPLDDAMRAQIAPLAKPYPKRAKEQDAEYPSALGGVTPTRTLQHCEDHAAVTA